MVLLWHRCEEPLKHFICVESDALRAERLCLTEETDEDEEDEEVDSEEEESEEDLTESTIAPHSRPPYGLIPRPPVWVQRNQGLGENQPRLCSIICQSALITRARSLSVCSAELG